MEQADFDAFIVNLASTYLIRLFAEFETGLRSYWKSIKSKRPGIPVRDMIDSLSAKRSVDDLTRVNVHTVRKYRNSLVHEEDSEADTVSLAEARRFLCRFFDRMPEDW